MDELQKDSLYRLSQLQQSYLHRKNLSSIQLQLYEFLLSNIEKMETALKDYSQTHGNNSRRRNSFQMLSENTVEFKYYDQVSSGMKNDNCTLLRCYKMLDGPLVASKITSSTFVYICLSLEDTIGLLRSGWQGIVPQVNVSNFRSSIEEALTCIPSSNATTSVFCLLHCEIDSQHLATLPKGLSLTSMCMCCQPPLPGGLQGLCEQIEENLHASALPSRALKKSPVDILADFQG